MADFNFGDGLRKVFLAGVGALATTVEKSQEIVDDLVKKGELTVEQGKALNAELKHKVEEAKEAPESKDAARPKPKTRPSSSSLSYRRLPRM